MLEHMCIFCSINSGRKVAVLVKGSTIRLMLQQPQTTLHHHVLQYGSWRHVDRAAFSRDNDDRTLEHNATAQIDRTRDGQMVQLQDLWDAGYPFLEIADLLEVIAELDERGRAEAVLVHDELAVLQTVEI